MHVGNRAIFVKVLVHDCNVIEMRTCMKQERITVVLHLHKKNEKIDLDIPTSITANEFILGLNSGFCLGMEINDLSKCYLKTENPIALLKGNKTLEEYGLRNGTIINYTL